MNTYRTSLSAFVALALIASPIALLHAKGDFVANAKKAIAAKKAADAKGKNKKGSAPTAASLVADMQRAVAFIAKSATESKPAISMKAKEARPFWLGLQTISEGLDAIEEGIKAKDASMVDGLEDVGGGVTTVNTSWGIIRGAYPKSQVGRGVIALSSAYEMYLHHFGPAVARFKLGGKATEDEIAEVAEAHAKLEALTAKLHALQSKAKKNSYQQRLVVDLLLLIEEITSFEVNSTRSYCKFIYQWDRLENTLYGYTDIVEAWYPGFYEQWGVITTDCKTISTMFADNSSYYESWDYTSTSIASYGVYYEETAAVASISVEQEASYEESVEAYSEETATEESDEETSEINEEVEVDEDEESTLAEEVEDSEDDHDGDGVSDEDDDDDDNDGTMDEEDGDDDGDGVDDGEDDEDEDDAQDDEDEDDDGIDDSDEGDEE
jgi:hypothetical protein